jgi:transcriptional regulator with XRE-family HTH domain
MMSNVGTFQSGVVANFLLGREIANYREQCSLSQTVVAEKMNADYHWLKKIEAGLDTISASDLYVLCKILGVSMNEIYNRVFEDQALSRASVS